MRKEVPAGVVEMLAVPGLRPLEQAAREDRIKSVDAGARCLIHLVPATG
jgi:hypothetical protein